MPTRVSNPFDLFTDKYGAPLESGYIYIGTVNLNPVTNQAPVFWDEALTIPASQPIRTVSGFPSYNGAPSRLYVPDSYSILVQDKQQRTVFSSPSFVDATYASLLVAIKTVDGSGSGIISEGLQSLQITDLNFDPALLGLAVREARVYTTASGPLNQPDGVATSTYYTLILTQPVAGEYRVVLIPGGTVGEIYTRTYSALTWGAWSSTGGGAPLALAAVASPYSQIAGAAPITYSVTTGASAFTFNLATAASQIGRRITIVKADSGAGALNIVPNGADVIGAAGNVTVPLGTQFQTITLLATAAGRWEIVDRIVDTDTALTANSDARVPSQKAVKSFVGGAAGGTKVSVFNSGVVSGNYTPPQIAVGETGISWVIPSGAITGNLPATGTFNYSQNIAGGVWNVITGAAGGAAIAVTSTKYLLIYTRTA